MDYNIYFNPEKFNLEIVATLELCDYGSFDDHIVWKDVNGDLWYGHDSGCSCPTPFDHMTKDDLRKVDKEGWHDFRESILMLEEGALQEKCDFLDKVRRHLKINEH